ncbi:MAG: hypothetical protein ACK5NG_11655 [Chthoniobacterales bacterium]
MKKLTRLLLPVALVFIVAACSSLPEYGKSSRSQKTHTVEVPAVEPPNINSWTSITRTFAKTAKTAELPFAQTWLPEKDSGFREGTVRLAHGKDRLFVLADLTDEQLATRAKQNNENLWSLGDVFEIFVRDLGGDLYYEFHTAPNGKNLQLSFPSQRFFESRNFELDDLKVAKPTYDYRIRKTAKGWQIYAELDARTLFGAGATPLTDRQWLVSFGRYDYPDTQEESKGILSSTSPHKRPLSYHHQRYWTRIVFAPEA